MKVVFFEIKNHEKEVLSPLLEGLEMSFYEEKLTAETMNLAQGAEIVSVFVDSEVSADIIGPLSSLKLITTRSTGYDHIDTAFAKTKNIQVANVPSYGARTVAEFAFGLILNLSRKIFNAKHQLMESDNFEIEQLEGFDLYGKTLGVVGAGKIGKNMVRIAQGFGMNVVAYDVHPDEAFAAETNLKYVGLEELLAAADIVTLHTPYLKETHHLINSGNIYKMKKGAYLINTARGELIDTDALFKALTGGHLAGAGLDVLEAERQLKEEAELLTQSPEKIKDLKTLIEDHILINLPNVIITPHIAFFSREAHEEILKVTAENIKSFMAGSPQNLV